MKKVITILIISSTLVFSLSACGKVDTNTKDINKTTNEIVEENNTVSKKNTKVENTKQKTEDVTEIKEETNKEEAKTVEEVNEIVSKAVDDLANYKMQLNMTIKLSLDGTEFGMNSEDFSMIIESNSSNEVLIDRENNISYSIGTTTSNVMGTETVIETEQWSIQNEDVLTSYTLIPETNNWVKETSYSTNEDFIKYYNTEGEFEIINETGTEYIINGYVEYSRLSDVVSENVGDTEMSPEYKIPVTYVIDKESNIIKSMNLLLDDEDNSGMYINIDMTITPDDTISLKLPEEIEKHSVDSENLN